MGDNAAKAPAKGPAKDAQKPCKAERPPLIGDPSIQGPFRIAIAQSCRSQEELDALESDYNWFRYSTFAAPMLLAIGATLAILLVFTLWQTGGSQGSIKWIDDGVPRVMMLEADFHDDEEGGILEWVRQLRIASTTLMFIATLSFLTYYFKKTSKILAFIGIFCAFVSAIIACVTFSAQVNDNSDAHWCPVGHYDVPDMRARFGTDVEQSKETIYHQSGMNRLERRGETPQFLYTTYEKCEDESNTALLAMLFDLVFLVVGLLLVVMAVKNIVLTNTAYFQLRTGWKAQHENSGEKIVDVGLHKTWTQLIMIAVLFLLATVIAQTVVLVKLHNNKTTFVLHGPEGHTTVMANQLRVENANLVVADEGQIETKYLPNGHPWGGEGFLETPGWPKANTRFRVIICIAGLFIIFFNLFPFTSSVIATVFAVMLFCVFAALWTVFAFDISEVNRATDMVCPPKAVCNHTEFLMTITIDFVAAVLIGVYLLLEFFLRMFFQCNYCNRKFTPLEIGKHRNELCSKRPVPCKNCGKEMRAAEYKYRHRFHCIDNNDRWCHSCQVSIPLHQWEQHKRGECRQEAVQCDGCGRTFTHDDLKVHAAVCGGQQIPAEIPHGAEHPRPPAYTNPQYGSQRAPLPVANAKKWVGVNLEEEISPQGSSSLLVVSVNPNSPALRGGIREGDIVTHANGQPMNNKEDFRTFIASSQVGESTTWRVSRLFDQATNQWNTIDLTVVIDQFTS